MIDKRLIRPYIHVLRGIFLFFFTSSCLPIYFTLFLYLSSSPMLHESLLYDFLSGAFPKK